MCELVRYIARNLVEKPEAVHIETREEDGVPVYVLRVAPEDIGKIIGKQGRTAKVIRALMTAARTEASRARLEIVEKTA